MKGLVYYGPKDLRITQLDDVKPLESEVLIKIKAAGICGSDIHGYLGTTGRRIPPVIMGHEFSGDIVETGKDVKGLYIGDRVTVQPLIFCGTCSFCKQGLTNLCDNKRMYGVMDLNGSMAEYICVSEQLVFKLPDSVSYIDGSMMEPFAVAYSAVKRAGFISDKDILIVGAGTIGDLILQIIKTNHCAKVFVSDVCDERLSLAKKLGADFVINPGKEDMKKIIESTGTEGIDTAFEVVGLSATVQQALSVLKKGGTCIWVGNLEKMITLNMQETVSKELNICGTYAYTHRQFSDAIQLLSKHKFDFSPIITTVPFEKGTEMFEKLVNKDSSLIKVILEM